MAGQPDDWIPRTEGFWSLPAEDVLRATASTASGLASAEAARRRDRLRGTALRPTARLDDLTLLVRQFRNPLVLILVIATILSGFLGAVTDALIILGIILLSALLGFWQERGASHAVADLLEVVEVKAEVVRDGRVVEVPLADIVPGDIVELNAGDIVPGDGLVLESRALLADEAALTGESFPVEKLPGVVPEASPVASRSNAVFLGTHVVSGSGRILVVHTGSATEFGHVAAGLRGHPIETGFERGMRAFGGLLFRTMVILVVAITAINLVLARPLLESALFSLALAVGLTPQLLPAIVTISLSQGARMMARERVIVKRLDVIEDFGGMTILCTDKTGTMTTGTVTFTGALGIDGLPSPTVRRAAWLNAQFQTGFTNPIDVAIVAAGEVRADGARRLDELPYDFSRRRLSVLVDDGGPRVMLTKGAVASVLSVCTRAEIAAGEIVDLGAVRSAIEARYQALSEGGDRVLGVASREVPGAERIGPADEADLTFLGFLTLADPVKPGVEATLGQLAAAGISVRMVTGDNRLVAARIGRAVGLESTVLMTGDQLAQIDDADLAEQVLRTGIFAEVDPRQKERLVRALRSTGRIVGYLGDGINDAPALHAADVGISVDTGVDVARDSAAIVLLDKDLRVLLDGVRQGRRTFANTMKYVFTTTSANFGNMLSMAVAAAVLPFLPLLADQILLVNLLTDAPAATIATDDVDVEQLRQPRGWDLAFVRRFMLVFGAISSVFDLLTFAALRLLFEADPALFRGGWFIESGATELAVLLVLRTRRPFFQSRPSRLLVLTSVAVAALVVAVPYSPLGTLLGLAGPPAALLLTLAVITAGYVAATELAKRWFYGRGS